MSLMDLLLNGPSAQDRYQQVAGMSGGQQPGISGSPVQGSGGPVGDVEAAARDFFLSNGYSRPDWRKVDSIIEQESGWDPSAMNDESGAAGLAQKISGFGGGYRENDPMSQIQWLFDYLGSHNYEGYGTGIDAAYQHKQATGWY